ncbi:MAG: branched-chain amino acid ABC transporter permease [Phycisphaerae bacterium]
MEYALHILMMVCIYVALGASLNLVAGYAGSPSLAHAAFYGLGAYVAGLMSLRLGSPFMLNLLCAVGFSAVLGAIVRALTMRIRGDHFIVVTLAFQVVVFSILYNWVSFTGGPMGLSAIPEPTVFGWLVSSHADFLLLGLVYCVLTLWVCRRIANSPFGRVLKAIREDEVLASAAGKDVAMHHVLIFMISAGIAAGAGVLFAHYMCFVDATSFTEMESIFIISIVIIGGGGSSWGPVVGALVLVGLPELFRFLGMPTSVAANVRQMLYGGLLIVFMLWRPQGLLGEYAFGGTRDSR